MPFKGIEIPKTEEDFESVESAKRRKKAESMRRRKEEFLERGVVMALYGAVEQKVKCACMSTDHLLFQKRTR